MIRAVYRDGTIQPLDQLPSEWTDGEPLEIRTMPKSDVESDTDDWMNERGDYATYTGEMPAHVREELRRRIAAFQALGSVEFEPGEEDEIHKFLQEMNAMGVLQMQQLGEQLP